MALKPFNLFTILLLGLLFSAMKTQAQYPDTYPADELLKLLVKKSVLTQREADSLQADLANKEQIQKNEENRHGTGTGGKVLQVSGLIQTRYQGYEQTGVNNSFDLHRARLDVKGAIDSNWTYEVYTEFSGTAKLLDAYSTYRITDHIKFTAGQFKIPFSLESLIADSQLEFIDRSQVAEALADRSKDIIGNQNGRDIGIQVNGSFARLDDHYLFDYTFGVFNGAGYDVIADNNNHKDIGGRLTVQPIKALSISADFYNGVGNYGTPAKKQPRNRVGFDARYVMGRLALQAEYDKGTDGAIKRDGWYGQATYFMLPKKLQLAAKYDTYDPNKTVKTDRTEIYTGGINYFFNPWTRFSVNYLVRHEDAVEIKNNTVEAQLQLTF